VVVAVVRYADVAIVATWHRLWGWFWQGRGQGDGGGGSDGGGMTSSCGRNFKTM
jgi:hypothetical protein